MESQEYQFSEDEQREIETNVQAILYTVAWDMERSLSNWEKVQGGFCPLRAEGQEQILLAYCVLDGNVVARHILSKRFWYTSATEILTLWGYPVRVMT